jgi:hypothetical protein
MRDVLQVCGRASSRRTTHTLGLNWYTPMNPGPLLRCHSFIFYTYPDAIATTSSHITTRVRLTSQVARSCARNSQAEKQPHRVSTRDLDSSHRDAIRTACAGAVHGAGMGANTSQPCIPTASSAYSPRVCPALTQEARQIVAHTHVLCRRRTGWLTRLTREGPWSCPPSTLLHLTHTDVRWFRQVPPVPKTQETQAH